ncbi:MAG: hypothetical protein GKR90_17630 [Pseudomonadales bacterium]|nr:hypothetical protein [Pseudomonadales bacterium]
MNQRLSSWLQVIGNFALLVGLGLVAIQINQATELTRIQMDNQWLGRADQRLIAFLGEDPSVVLAKAIDSPNELTTADILVLDNFIQTYVDYWYTIKRNADLGLVADARWREVIGLGTNNYAFGHEFGQAWWKNFEQHGAKWGGDAEFTTVMSEAVRQAKPTFMRGWIQGIRQNLGEQKSSAADDL